MSTRFKKNELINIFSLQWDYDTKLENYKVKTSSFPWLFCVIKYDLKLYKFFQDRKNARYLPIDRV